MTIDLTFFRVHVKFLPSYWHLLLFTGMFVFGIMRFHLLHDLTELVLDLLEKRRESWLFRSQLITDTPRVMFILLFIFCLFLKRRIDEGWNFPVGNEDVTLAIKNPAIRSRFFTKLPSRESSQWLKSHFNVNFQWLSLCEKWLFVLASWLRQSMLWLFPF